jgi:hypothetical protein
VRAPLNERKPNQGVQPSQLLQESRNTRRCRNLTSGKQILQPSIETMLIFYSRCRHAGAVKAMQDAIHRVKTNHGTYDWYSLCPHEHIHCTGLCSKAVDQILWTQGHERHVPRGACSMQILLLAGDLQYRSSIHLWRSHNRHESLVDRGSWAADESADLRECWQGALAAANSRCKLALDCVAKHTLPLYVPSTVLHSHGYLIVHSNL